MQNSFKAKLISLLLLYPLIINPATSKIINNTLLSTQLEVILNEKRNDLLKDLFLDKSLKQFEKQYLEFTKNYDDIQWSIKTISNQKNKTFLDIKITSIREISGQLYKLNSKQNVKIETIKNKIKIYKVLNE